MINAFSDNVLDCHLEKLEKEKQELKAYIDTIDCPDKMRAAKNVMHKDTILQMTKIAVTEMTGIKKDYIHNSISSMILDHNSDVEEKVDFLEQIVNTGGAWDSEFIIKNQIGNVYNNIENRIAKDLSIRLSKEIHGNLGIGPNQGIGEVFFALTGRGIGMAIKGDLQIYTKNVELKTTTKTRNYCGGRLIPTTGLGSNTSALNTMIAQLQSYGIPDSTVKSYQKKTGSLNLNNSGFENLRKMLVPLKSKEKTVELFVKILQSLYEDLNRDYAVKTISCAVDDSGNYCVKTIQTFFIIVAHDYYTSLKNHDSILFFNVENGNYATVENSVDYIKLINNNHLRIASHLTLTDERGKGSAQIIKL